MIIDLVFDIGMSMFDRWLSIFNFRIVIAIGTNCYRSSSGGVLQVSALTSASGGSCRGHHYRIQKFEFWSIFEYYISVVKYIIIGRDYWCMDNIRVSEGNKEIH